MPDVGCHSGGNEILQCKRSSRFVASRLRARRCSGFHTRRTRCFADLSPFAVVFDMPGRECGLETSQIWGFGSVLSGQFSRPGYRSVATPVATEERSLSLLGGSGEGERDTTEYVASGLCARRIDNVASGFHARRNKEIAVAIAEGPHPFPFRTRSLSPPAPMVLHGRLCGRVGRCRISLFGCLPCRPGRRDYTDPSHPRDQPPEAGQV